MVRAWRLKKGREAEMGLVYCCPTRGKPEYLDDMVWESMEKARLPDTKFVIGIDEDEQELYANSKLRKDERVIWSCEPREDSLGAKFNRVQSVGAQIEDADWFIMGVDDLAIQSIAWDVNVSQLAEHYPDGIGCVNFGRQWNEPGMPAFQMLSKKFIELNGFFMAPFFPFWWHDTWNLEMSRMIGRDCYLDVEVRYPQKEPMTPRRDISFWALYFDLMRPARVQKAREIILVSDSPAFLKYQLIQRLDTLVQEFEQRNARCRDPLWTMKFQAERVTDQLDARHERLLAKAQSVLRAIEQHSAEALEEESRAA